MNRTLQGILLAGTTGLCWGLTTLATKLIGHAGVAISTAVFTRMVVVAAALGPWLHFRHPDQLKISRHDFARIFCFSLLGPSGLYLGFMLSVVYLSAPTALVLHYAYPILTALCSPLVTGERPSRWDFVGAGLVAAGVTCSMLTPEWALNTRLDVRGLLWGAMAVAGLAGQTLLVRATVTKGGLGRWGFFYYTHLCGMFWIGLYVTLTGQWGEFCRVTPYIATLVLVPTLTGCLLGYSLYYKSLEYVPASVSSLMASLEILSGTMLTALATGVRPSLPEVVGCVCIFAAIALVSLSRLEKIPTRP